MQNAAGLLGEIGVDDNFDLTGWLEPGEPPVASPDEVGAFRFNCLAGHVAKDDPIVYPGRPGASHIHQFFGNTDTDANSNYQSLRTKGGSTCTRSTGTSPQRSAYWMPAMLDGAGNVVKADWMNTYYKQLPANDPNCAVTMDPAVTGRCIGMPNGIRFILGYNMQTMSGGPADTKSRDWWAMGFDCVAKPTGGDSFTGIKHTIKEIVDSGKCPAGAWLRVFVAFPQCWDGKNLDTPDHRSHIVMPPQSICPGDHPYRIPEIAVSAFFTVDENFFQGKWHLASDEMMPGAVAGSTLHMDYWEAWSPTFKGLWQRNCIDGHLTCSIGNVGDGRKIKGMGFDGPPPEHVLLPVSSIK
ncbi:DUF1996 domain-containing protein [Sphingomonas flavescens]|uniref:DUF1996 domain-containing protein n=1 Tax=Sphingomonas flavescens TaxID=3132797 RepID=UPI002804D72A|nr:DUF1996 domain-containing protein [Sphingomonas limnosediminicola]